MRKLGFLIPTGLAVLILTLVLLAAGREQPSLAVGQQPDERAQETVHTVSLPLAVRGYDPAYVSPFGIVMYGLVDDAHGLQVMQEAGANWISTIFDWGAVEPVKGTYDWSEFDAKATAAHVADMDLFVLFTGNPAWAAALPGGPVTDTQDLVNIVTLMAERYDCDGPGDADGHPCVNHWSFYAEPDNGDLERAKGGKGYFGHNAAVYAAELSQVSTAIHNASPRAQVLIGGLAYAWFEEDGGPFVRSFLTDTLGALNGMGGATKYLDAVAFHYYPTDPRWPSIKQKTAEIRAIMAGLSAGELPLLCPEMGFWSGEPGSSEDKQARELVQMFVQGWSAGAQPMSWYKVFDGEGEEPDTTCGLLRVDGSMKPSYVAYRTMTRELGGVAYEGPLGAAGAEGYRYRMSNGKQKTVLWSLSGMVHVAFPYTHLTLVNTLGEEFDISDNQQTSPGDVDGGIPGQIELEIYEDQPFYVEQK